MYYLADRLKRGTCFRLLKDNVPNFAHTYIGFGMVPYCSRAHVDGARSVFAYTMFAYRQKPHNVL